MRNALAILFLFFYTVSQAVPPRVFADGTLLRDRNGKTLTMRGINWSEPDLCDASDMARMKEWGVNVVRVWCDESSMIKSFDPTLGCPKVDLKAIATSASDNDVYVIFVLGDLDDQPANQAKPWRDSLLRERFRRCLSITASNLGSNPAVLAIEVQNEPPAGSNELEQYRSFNLDMARSIRLAAPETMVAIHGPFRLEDQDRRVVIPMRNILYVRNFWEPYKFTHVKPAQRWPVSARQGNSWIDARISRITAFRDTNQVPVMITEFGAMIHAPGNDELLWTRAVLTSFERRRLHGIYWGYKSYRSSSFHLYYNTVDRANPPVFNEWTDMLNLMKQWWKMNHATMKAP